MAYQKATQITSWSFSRYKTYLECPAKAKYKFVMRMKEPSGPAAERGNDVHKDGERYIKGEIKTLTKEYREFKEEMKAAKKTKGVGAEISLTFTKDWQPCEWNDWNIAWVRIKVDLMLPPNKEATVKIVDHKTGKIRDEYEEQLELYAVGALLHYPQAERAQGELWYLDHGIILPENPIDGTYERKELPKLIKLWEKRVTPMLSDKQFAPKPGNYCRWCIFSKAKNGPCMY